MSQRLAVLTRLQDVNLSSEETDGLIARFHTHQASVHNRDRFAHVLRDPDVRCATQGINVARGRGSEASRGDPSRHAQAAVRHSHPSSRSALGLR